MAGARPRVFLGYAPAEGALAHVVAAAMQRVGLDVWGDEYGQPSALSADAVRERIGASDFVVVLLSRSSIVSESVAHQVGVAANLRRPVAGVRVDDAPMSAVAHRFGDLPLLVAASAEAVADAVADRLIDVPTVPASAPEIPLSSPPAPPGPPAISSPGPAPAVQQERASSVRIDAVQSTARGNSRRRWLVLGAACLAAIGIGAIVVWAKRGDAAPRKRAIEFVRVTPAPVWVAANDRVWVTSDAPGGGFVTAVDTRPLTVGNVTGVGAAPYGVAATDAAVWVANGGSDTVSRVAADGSVTELPTGHLPYALASHGGVVWVTGAGDGTISEYSDSGSLQRSIAVGGTPQGIAWDGDSLWVAHAGSSPGCQRVNLASGKVDADIPMPDGVDAVAVGFGSVWVTNAKTGEVWRLDPQRMKVAATIRVGSGPQGVLGTSEGIWVSVAGIDQIVRIDPGSNRIVEHIITRAEPLGMAWFKGELIVANHSDGTIQVIR